MISFSDSNTSIAPCSSGPVFSEAILPVNPAYIYSVASPTCGCAVGVELVNDGGGSSTPFFFEVGLRVKMDVIWMVLKRWAV